MTQNLVSLASTKNVLETEGLNMIYLLNNWGPSDLVVQSRTGPHSDKLVCKPQPQWPFQEPKLEVPIYIYKAYVRPM